VSIGSRSDPEAATLTTLASLVSRLKTISAWTPAAERRVELVEHPRQLARRARAAAIARVRRVACTPRAQFPGLRCRPAGAPDAVRQGHALVLNGRASTRRPRPLPPRRRPRARPPRSRRTGLRRRRRRRPRAPRPACSRSPRLSRPSGACTRRCPASGARPPTRTRRSRRRATCSTVVERAQARAPDGAPGRRGRRACATHAHACRRGRHYSRSMPVA
jgi:hypothetical protein